MLKDLEYLQSQYFTFDKPIPFKDRFFIYPAYVKDYYDFFSAVEILMIDKNRDPQTIPMSYLKFLEFMSSQEDGYLYNIRLNKLLELILHVKNGFFCPHCNYEIIEEEILDELRKVGNTAEERNRKLRELKTCPHCHKMMYDIVRFVKKDGLRCELYIKDVAITPSDFDRLKDIILYQNINDYKDRSAMDTDLADEMEEMKRLQSSGVKDPPLEKKLTCIVASSSYTYETVQNISIRKMNMLLKTADSKLFYLAAKIGSMSGFVTFKEEPEHWIYEKEKTLFDNGAVALDDFKKKMSSVT